MPKNHLEGNLGDVSLALHLSRCPRPERTKQHKQLNVIHRVLDLSAFHEDGNA